MPWVTRKPLAEILSLHERTDLLGQYLEIEIVPGFGDLSIFDPEYRHAGEFCWLVRRRNSQRVALVRARHNASGSDFVSLADGVHDLDVNIGKRPRELKKERFEPGRSAKFAAMLIKQPVRDGIVGEKAIDCLDLGFVPHLIEPFVGKSFAFHWIKTTG